MNREYIEIFRFIRIWRILPPHPTHTSSPFTFSASSPVLYLFVCKNTTNFKCDMPGSNHVHTLWLTSLYECVARERFPLTLVRSNNFKIQCDSVKAPPHIPPTPFRSYVSHPNSAQNNVYSLTHTQTHTQTPLLDLLHYQLRISRHHVCKSHWICTFLLFFFKLLNSFHFLLLFLDAVLPYTCAYEYVCMYGVLLSSFSLDYYFWIFLESKKANISTFA